MFRLAFPRGQGPAFADLPPTLQPRAIAASAPPSDHVRTAALSGLVYLTLVGGAFALSKLAPPPPLVEVHPQPPPEPTFITEPPHSIRVALPQPGPAHSTGGSTEVVAPVLPSAPPTADPTEASSDKPTDNHLQVPVGTGVGPSTISSSQLPPGTIGTTGPAIRELTHSGLAILHQVDPIYPDFARRAHLQGIVVLLMTVDERGQPTTVQVQEGHMAFHEAAMQAARQWRFEPAQVDGRAVSARFRLTLKFSLR